MTRLRFAACLRQNAFVEPLFNRWYAWSYLVSGECQALGIPAGTLFAKEGVVLQ